MRVEVVLKPNQSIVGKLEGLDVVLVEGNQPLVVVSGHHFWHDVGVEAKRDHFEPLLKALLFQSSLFSFEG